MSHQPSIWNREFLISQLPDNEHPWRNERLATRRMRKFNAEILHVDLFAENDKPPINANLEWAKRSAYNTISVNAQLNETTPHFIAELLETGNPKLISYAEKLKYNYNNKLTHDGKPGARKVNIFKKIFTFINNFTSIFKLLF